MLIRAGLTAGANKSSVLGVWSSVAVHGGGLVTGHEFANDGTHVVRTDVGGAYIFDGTQWVQLMTQLRMPVATFGGYRQHQGCMEIQIAPSNSNVIYLFYKATIYKSTDKGLTFSITNYPQNVATDVGILFPNNSSRLIQRKFAIDPANPNVVYSCNPIGSPQVTFDGGVTWGAVPNVPNGTAATIGVQGWTFDHTSGTTNGRTNIIYCIVTGSGTWQSTDAGVSFSQISSDVGSIPHWANTAVSSDGVFYVVDKPTASWRISRWQSGAWTSIKTASQSMHVAAHPVTAGVVCFYIDFTGPAQYGYSSNYGTAFTTYTAGFSAGNQTYASTDAPWMVAEIQRQVAAAGATSVTVLKFDPSSPNDLWATMFQGIVKATIPNSSTPPAWTTVQTGIKELVTTDIMHETGTALMLSGWDQLAYKLSAASPGTPPSDMIKAITVITHGWSFAIDPQDHTKMVIAADSTGAGYSTDGGTSWAAFNTIPAGHQGPGAYSSIAINNGVIIWAPFGASNQRFLARSVDNGANWTLLNAIPNIPGTGDTGWGVPLALSRKSVAADYVDANTFYASNYRPGQTPDIRGVWRSTDAGVNWTLMGNPWPTPTNMYAIDLKAVPGNQGHLFATWGFQTNATHPISTNTFMRSRDGGATWTACPNALEVNKFGFGKAYPGAVYPTLYMAGFVNGIYGIWMSKDEGNTWAQITSTLYGSWPHGLNDSVSALEGDKDTVGRFFVGFLGNGAVYCDVP